jgi:hypothetical protein
MLTKVSIHSAQRRDGSHSSPAEPVAGAIDGVSPGNGPLR